MATISTAADHLADSARHAASTTRGSLLDLGTQLIRLVNTLREDEARSLGKLLGRVHLQRRQSPLMPALWVAAGAIVAGATAFMLSPSGAQVMRRVADAMGSAKKKAGVPRPAANHAKAEDHR